MDEGKPITALLQEFAQGDKQALDRLMPLVYTELKRLAGGYLRDERPGHTLQPTALVHEAYFRLLGQQFPTFQNRAHFLSLAARVMRQILVDHARGRKAGKRGSGAVHLSVDDAWTATVETPPITLALADALDDLERKDPFKARLVEMRYFGGLTLEESAEVAGVTFESVRYELRLAQAWLNRELSRSAGK